MEKYRAGTHTIAGSSAFWVDSNGSTPPPSPTLYSVSVPSWEQRTRTVPTGWPIIQRFFRGSYGHIRPEALHFYQSHDWGSNFRTEKSSVSSSLSDVAHGGYWSGLFKYLVDQSGPVLLAGSTAPPLLGTSEWTELNTELFGLGGTMIARSQPLRPQLNLAVTVGELKKDGIPTIIGSLMRRSRDIKDVFRNGGSEYLNAQFGWAPLVRDIQNLAKSAAQSRRILEQNERDVTRLVRRRRQLPVTVETTHGLTREAAYYKFYPGTPLSGVTESNVKSYQQLTDVHEVNEVTTKSWFSAGFRYYFYSYGEGLEYFTEIERQANTLLGTRLDPEVLWNLAPWTWLSDWFLNTGDVMSNLSSMLSDHVVMQYGYLMQTKEVETKVSMPPISGRNGSGWEAISPPYRITSSYVRKARVKASPFGFGLNPSEFTSDQWAILGALGISRVT